MNVTLEEAYAAACAALGEATVTIRLLSARIAALEATTVVTSEDLQATTE